MNILLSNTIVRLLLNFTAVSNIVLITEYRNKDMIPNCILSLLISVIFLTMANGGK